MKTFICIYCSLLIVGVTLGHTCGTFDYVNNCVYTIVCEINSGSGQLYSCDQPQVTFVMKKSTAVLLRTSFFGMTNFDSRVRKFIGLNNTWPSIDSYAFKYYIRTIEMDLSYNKISVLADDTFRDLQYLQKLNLSHNIMSHLSDRSLYIGLNNQLAELDLSENFLSNFSTCEFFNTLQNLEELRLNNNMLVAIGDSCFVNLKKLTTLKLQNNYLWYLNVTLVNLKYLKYLDISQNQLLKLSGYEINRVTAIEFVNMSSNSIKTIDETCFNQAFNLKTLDLSNNLIQSDITALMFINNNNLSYLNLYNNNITKIADNAFKHNNLIDYFNVEKNNITYDITKDTLIGLQNLTKLLLYQQNVVAIRNDSFRDMQHLTIFNASKNNIDTIENGSFIGADAISILDLSYNKINNILFINSGLRNVTELYLNNNNISLLPPNILTNLSLLVRLDISMNKINRIEPNTLPLNKLQYLNIKGNVFSGEITKGIFNGAQMVRNLDLSNSKFTKIDEEALIDLPLVATMNLSHNLIESIHPLNFFNTNNMYSLDLSFNLLSSIQMNGTELKNLKALYLNNNKITNTSTMLINASKMFYLDLSYNNIEEVSESMVKCLPNLKVLIMSFNKLKVFNNQAVNAMSHLTDVRLASNSLLEINLSYYPNLVNIDLSNNSLTAINKTFFENLRNLESMDISNNDISELPPGVFQNANILKILNISCNHISKLRYGSLTGLSATELIDLSRNELSELDVHIFHECVKLKKLVVDYNRIKTLDVERFVAIAPRLEMLSIGGNPLNCSEIIRHVSGNRTRRVEVTSIDKIYHEDNAYGIKCGDDVTAIPIETVEVSSLQLSTVLICILVVILVLVVIGAIVFRQRLFNSGGMLQFSGIELNRSNNQLTASNFLD